MSRCCAPLFAVLLLSMACGGSTQNPSQDAGSSVDGGNARDAGAARDGGDAQDGGNAQDGGGLIDGGGASDGGPADAGLSSDAGFRDAGLAMDAGTSADAGMIADGGPCHALSFGLATVPIRLAVTLPTMTGGTIAPGIYDAVDAQSTTLSVADGGTYRGTWSIVDNARLDTLDQLTLSGTPPTPTPRSFTWSTTGARLLRNGRCSSTSMFDNEYRVQVDGGATYLEVRQSSVMFTFKKR